MNFFCELPQRVAYGGVLRGQRVIDGADRPEGVFRFFHIDELTKSLA